MKQEISKLDEDVKLLTEWVTEQSGKIDTLAKTLDGTMQCVTSLAYTISEQIATIRAFDGKKIDKTYFENYRLAVNNLLSELCAFRDRVENYPKISIKPCKKCDHDTLFRDNPDGTFTCLVCGTTYQKTQQEFIREVKNKE